MYTRLLGVSVSPTRTRGEWPAEFRHLAELRSTHAHEGRMNLATMVVIPANGSTHAREGRMKRTKYTGSKRESRTRAQGRNEDTRPWAPGAVSCVPGRVMRPPLAFPRRPARSLACEQSFPTIPPNSVPLLTAILPGPRPGTVPELGESPPEWCQKLPSLVCPSCSLHC
jgi:hypothetical protein